MSFKLAKETSLRNKYACYGWIRETENVLKLAQIVPSMVKVICLLYFRDDEIFDNVNEKGIHLSSNKKVISSKKSYHKSCIFPCLNYGITDIYSIQQTKIQWDLKVNTSNDIRMIPTMLIGIANGERIYYLFRYNKIWIEGGICRLEHRDGAAKYGSGDKLSDRQEWKRYDDGDRVSLHLDLKQKKIKVIVNGFDLGFTSVPIVTSPQIQYKLCVILHGGFSSVEILDFNIY